MIYRKQTGFDDFHCIADQCPKSCCEGWQIVIDPDSYQTYQEYSGPFKERLENGIDHRELSFLQYGKRCSMLSESGLCDMQSSIGEAYLCRTCREYPRHLEDFLDLREYSLSLSCPEAVRMMMDPTFHFDYSDCADDTLDDPEEFEDFDPLLFDELLFARKRMMAIAKDRAKPLSLRMEEIAGGARALQDLYDQGDIFAMDQVSFTLADDPGLHGQTLSDTYMLSSLDLLLELETLEDGWPDTLHRTRSYWRSHPAISQAWDTSLADDTLSGVFENLLLSLLFTYVCGSIYDGQIYARTMIAIMSVKWMWLIHTASPALSLQETIYLFSREVEHSDLNINALIAYFEEEL